MTIITRRDMVAGSGALIAAMATSALQAQNSPPPPPTFPGQPDWWHAEPFSIAPWNAPAKVIVTDKNEPGERLIVSGTVTSGKTPMRGVSVYAYHTDAKGLYDPEIPRPFEGHPRLRAYMRTDAQGRYEFRTIRPASYPTTHNPPHIHFVVYMPGYQVAGPEVRFEGDHLIPDACDAQTPKPDICAPHSFSKDPTGIWHLRFDFNLKPLVSSRTSPVG